MVGSSLRRQVVNLLLVDPREPWRFPLTLVFGLHGTVWDPRNRAYRSEVLLDPPPSRELHYQVLDGGQLHGNFNIDSEVARAALESTAGPLALAQGAALGRWPTFGQDTYLSLGMDRRSRRFEAVGNVAFKIVQAAWHRAHETAGGTTRTQLTLVLPAVAGQQVDPVSLAAEVDSLVRHDPPDAPEARAARAETYEDGVRLTFYDLDPAEGSARVWVEVQVHLVTLADMSAAASWLGGSSQALRARRQSLLVGAQTAAALALLVVVGGLFTWDQLRRSAPGEKPVVTAQGGDPGTDPDSKGQHPEEGPAATTEGGHPGESPAAATAGGQPSRDAGATTAGGEPGRNAVPTAAGGHAAPEPAPASADGHAAPEPALVSTGGARARDPVTHAHVGEEARPRTDAPRPASEASAPDAAAPPAGLVTLTGFPAAVRQGLGQPAGLQLTASLGRGGSQVRVQELRLDGQDCLARIAPERVQAAATRTLAMNRDPAAFLAYVRRACR